MAKSRRGPRGFKGTRGAPGIKPAEILAIIKNIEEIQDQAAVSFKRIAQIQVQLDATLKALKDMGDRAARQRKQR